MRIIILLSIVLAAAASHASRDYTETRNLDVDAGGLETLLVKAGAGNLDIRGVPGQDKILVTATIIVPDADEDDGQQIVSREMRLSLASDTATARLESRFKRRFWGFGSNGRIDLDVTVPPHIDIDVDDGSGEINISGIVADLAIDDGSGPIEMRAVGNVSIDDGSGSIDVADANGDVYINDGSGDIEVARVTGSVTIDDGSGSINVSDVGKDLVIIDAGSGSVDYSAIQGRVEHET